MTQSNVEEIVHRECPVESPEQACVFFVQGEVHVGLSDTRMSFRCFGKKEERSIEDANRFLRHIRVIANNATLTIPVIG